jgi:hypothetical protein
VGVGGLDLKHSVGKAASDMVVEVDALGVGPQQIVIGLEGHTGVLIRGPVAEVHLKNRSTVIVGDVR